MKDEVKDDDATQTEQKQRRSLDDAGAYTFHPTPSNIYRPTRNRPHCRVLLLDGQHHTFPVDKKAKAFVAINELFHHLDLKDLQEKEFFSIYYIDTSGCRIFLNPFKQIRKQLPNASSRTTWDLYFGVQFYATELRLLSDEITVYQYVLQICRDIKEKRINADRLKKLELVSLLVQANCGDYDAEEHKPGYVDPYIDMIYNPSEIPIGLPNSVSEEHKKKTGLTPNQADDDFFTEAKGIYRFGQQVFPVQDRRGQSGEIGASLKGLYFHKDGKLFMNIPWEDVITVGYRNKKIRIRYHPKGGSDHEEEMLYLYSSKPNAKLVWRGCVEQHTFFRLSIPTPLVSNTTRSYHSFNRNSELRFSRGRTLYQMLRGERKQLPPIRRSLSLIIHTDNKKRPSKEGSPDIREAATPKSKSPTPSPIDNPESFNNVMPRSSTASETLQDKIEKALSEKRLDRSDFGSDQANSDINITVEINYSGGEESKSDAEEQIQSDSIKAESDDDSTFDKGDASCDLMKVEITKSNPDLTNIVEFSSSVKNDTSFMVMLEETSPSPPPDLKDIAMVEGKYRSDSIITNDLGPAAQYLLERSNLKDGTVSATAVDIEVRTPTPSHDETGAEFMEQELNEGLELDVYQSPEVVTYPVVAYESKEDDEELVIAMRSKLYRFDTVSLQWKECGVGDIQILKHKTISAYRILMKRESTNTVLASYQLTANPKLLPLPSTNCAWEWNTQAGNEANSEKLAMRFRSAEIAMKFKEAFDKCQAELRTNKTSNFPADGMAVGEDGYAVKQNVIHNGDD